MNTSLACGGEWWVGGFSVCLGCCLVLELRASNGKKRVSFYNKLGTPSNIFSSVASRNEQKLGVGAYQIRPLLNGTVIISHEELRSLRIKEDYFLLMCHEWRPNMNGPIWHISYTLCIVICVDVLPSDICVENRDKCDYIRLISRMNTMRFRLVHTLS
jgi:hypothetical protein